MAKPLPARGTENAAAALDKLKSAAAAAEEAHGVLDRYLDNLRDERDALATELAASKVAHQREADSLKVALKASEERVAAWEKAHRDKMALITATLHAPLKS